MKYKEERGKRVELENRKGEMSVKYWNRRREKKRNLNGRVRKAEGMRKKHC